MKRLLLVLALLAAGLTLLHRPILDHIVRSRMDQTLQRADTSLLTDGKLHVFLCGTAAALPDPDRAGACTAVIAGGELAPKGE